MDGKARRWVDEEQEQENRERKRATYLLSRDIAERRREAKDSYHAMMERNIEERPSGPRIEVAMVSDPPARPVANEILTHKTTCTNEMAKETTSKIICQKRPAVSGGTPGQATRGMCHLGQCRQGPAAVGNSSMCPC
jgi:hypothetical protein